MAGNSQRGQNSRASLRETVNQRPLSATMGGLQLEDAPLEDVYIAVMGITGAGKSTLISKLTGSREVNIGFDLSSGLPQLILEIDNTDV
jgi:putative ribosome biogenesis GTPase RsgA